MVLHPIIAASLPYLYSYATSLHICSFYQFRAIKIVDILGG
nr:MAG TPA: hypothetical protein [Caudoviricetes sp.]